MNIIEEEGVYELEDNHDFEMIDTTYEIDGDLDIKIIQFINIYYVYLIHNKYKSSLSWLINKVNLRKI